MLENIVCESWKHHYKILSYLVTELGIYPLTMRVQLRLLGIVTTIFGSTLKPFVSSSKNRKSPALDAGKWGSFFFTHVILKGRILDIKTFLSIL